MSSGQVAGQDGDVIWFYDARDCDEIVMIVWVTRRVNCINK